MTIDHDDALAALCVWEAMLEGRAQLPGLNDRFASVGTVAMRSEAIALGGFANRVYAAMPVDARDDRAFGWEIVPAIVAARYAPATARLDVSGMALHVAAEFGFVVTPAEIPGWDGLFVAVLIRAKHDRGDGCLQSVTKTTPANLWSVEARRTDGTHAVLTDHGTEADAQNAALLLAALIGLPIEKTGGAA